MSSTRNKSNRWFARQNHTKLAKSELTKPLIKSGFVGVNGELPGVAIDFAGDGYRKGDGLQKFSDVMTHARSSNATMVDSDGNLKWAPHNLLTYSEDFSNAAWSKLSAGTGSAPVVTANAGTAPDGTATADRLELDRGAGTTAGDLSYLTQSLSAGSITGTLGIWLKSNDGTSYEVTLRLGTTLFDYEAVVTNEWQFFTVSGATTVDRVQLLLYGDRNQQTADILAWGAHVYRSDLGGMVNNPDRGDSYVPTTASAVYLPRRNHYSGGVNKGLLLESEARTNLITYSQDFTDASWSKANSTVSASAGVSPSGENDAQKLIPDDTATNGNVGETVSVSSGPAYTVSFFAKAVEESAISLVSNLDGTFRATVFDLSSGVVSSEATNWTAQVEDYGNGWYRCIATATSAVTSVTVQLGNNSAGWTGDGTSGVLLYGATIEEGATPSSYIPTAGSTATRAAETLTIPAANMPSYTTAVSFSMNGEITYADTGNAVEAEFFNWSVDGDNRIRWVLDTQSTLTGQFEIRQETANVTDLVQSADDAYSPGINTAFNLAARHGSTFVNGAVDGVALTENATPTALADLSTADAILGLTFMGTISEFAVWPVDIGDTGIEEASS